MFSQIQDDTLFLQIFTGPYAGADLFDELRTYCTPRMSVDRFTPHFPDWLAAADLSVSMAGYNTCMNILAAGVPALLYPFNQNREQSSRVKILAGIAPFTILHQADLRPQQLRELVYNQLKKPRFKSPVNLDGALNTVNQIEKWQRVEMV
jgi:predicted glycosyltransferase